MTVIIPHKTEELKLINIQKNLIKKLNSHSLSFYQVFPLWIPLQKELLCCNKNELKNTASNIKSVTLTNFYYSDKTIYIKGKVSFIKDYYDKTDYIINLPFAKLYINLNNDKTINSPLLVKDLLNKTGLEENFPLSLRIFRLGITTSPTSNSLALSDFVWVKIKQKI